MALNDGVLADVGLIDPVTGVMVATTIAKIFGSGPTQAFQDRQAYRDAGAVILAKLKALIPTLPEWLREIVANDRKVFLYKITRDNMKLADYKAVMAWMQGRETAWQAMTAPKAPVRIEPGVILKGTVREAVARGELPPGVTEPAVVVSPGVPVQEAGFNWPVLLVAAGVLAWIVLGKK